MTGLGDNGPVGRPASAAGYTFGDSDLAARRLALVAAAFAKSTRQFLLTRSRPAPGSRSTSAAGRASAPS